MNKQTLIVGKNGKTGSRVDALLTQAGYQTRAVSRGTAPAFDWDDPSNWLDVMSGCDAAYVCFQPDLAVPAATQAIEKFIHVAKQAGIAHIVLLSGRGEEGAQKAEQILMASGLSWNVVRASWFAQNFSEGFLIEGILNQTVALPAGDIPEPFIDVDDIAEVAVACLTRASLSNQVFEVTGPELLTFKQCVAKISVALARPINYVPITCDEFLEGLKAQGLPSDVLWLMNELFSVVMDGRNSYVCAGVEDALGRSATSFDDYVAKNIERGAWVLPAEAKSV